MCYLSFWWSACVIKEWSTCKAVRDVSMESCIHLESVTLLNDF